MSHHQALIGADSMMYPPKSSAIISSNRNLIFVPDYPLSGPSQHSIRTSSPGFEQVAQQYMGPKRFERMSREYPTLSLDQSQTRDAVRTDPVDWDPNDDSCYTCVRKKHLLPVDPPSVSLLFHLTQSLLILSSSG